MWTWQPSTGKLTSPGGSVVGSGYSGCGEGLNNSAMQAVHDIGPIPLGNWNIGTFFDDPGGKGPLVAHLTPADGTETYGRTGMMIHGDNALMNHTASKGCLILARILREMLVASNDRVLRVIA